MSIADRTLNPETLEPEEDFRYQVRDILGLSWDTRDAAIFERLKQLVREHDASKARRLG